MINRGAAPVVARPTPWSAGSARRTIPTAGPSHVGPMGVFNGAADYDNDFSDVAEARPAPRSTAVGGWLGFTDKYWLAAVIPRPGRRRSTPPSATTRADRTPTRPTISARQPGRSRAGRPTRYARTCSPAPRRSSCSNAIRTSSAPPLERAIDWGWFHWFMKPIFSLLNWLFAHDRQFRRGDHLPHRSSSACCSSRSRRSSSRRWRRCGRSSPR